MLDSIRLVTALTEALGLTKICELRAENESRASEAKRLQFELNRNEETKVNLWSRSEAGPQILPEVLPCWWLPSTWHAATR